MFESLLANNLNNLMPVGYTIATWVLKATDLSWLEREYNKMLDFFRDSPAYEWITRDAREEGREEGREQGLERGREEALKEVCEDARQKIVTLVNERFPKLTRRARIQVKMTDDFQALQEAIIFICSTQDAAAVANILDNLDKGED